MWMRITKRPAFSSVSSPTQFLLSVAKFASKAKAKAKARAKEKAACSKAQLLLKNFKAPPNSSNSTVSTSNFNNNNNNNNNNNIPSLYNLFTPTAISLRTTKLDDDYDDLDIDYDEFTGVMGLSWISGMSNDNSHRREVSREKKNKLAFSNVQTGRFVKLTKLCSKKIETDMALELFKSLGQEPKLKDYTAFIKSCIEKLKAATDEDAVCEHIHKAHQIFLLARANHFEMKEEMYGPLLTFFIDYGMADEFDFFTDLISDGSPDSVPRLAYYQVLLWLRVDNEVKFQELCHSVVADISQENYQLREQLLLALCEGDRKEEFLTLLQTLNITEITPVSHLESVFRALGKFLLEPLAKRFVLMLKSSTDIKTEDISTLIWEYAISMPNFPVEDAIIKFQQLHAKLEVLPTAAQYAKLIRFCCNLHKVHEALNIVDEAFKSGVSLPLETFNSILDACNRSCDLNLVHKIKTMIYCHNLNPNLESYRRMILLHVKMKDFTGAYELISDFKKVEEPVACLYNIILDGFYREKNIQSARNVLKRMEDDGVKPDALTFSYLIANSDNEEDIIKFYEQMSSSGTLPVKQVYMALINAYAACGQFDKAKEVLLDKGISGKSLNELKNVLIRALASNGQYSCALKLYEDVKKDECHLDPKAIKALIDHFESEGDLNKMLVLLEDLNHSPFWVDSCFRVISYCVKQENLRVSADLIKQLKDRFIHAQVDTEVIFDEIFYGLAEKTNMQFGLNLLKAIKEEFGVSPSRKSLDFLLNSCVNAKDANACFIIWKEYETAGLPYNVLSYVRMYQALLASGDTKSAAKILSEISREDRYDTHVKSIINACDKTYREEVSTRVGKKKKTADKKTEKNKWEALSELFYS